ncbi:MAG: hypothetical protein COC24_002445 [Alphaproteobacteria bacterium]|nr:hypothetical protein [Alphaproteobacteria bacterium]
MPHTKPIYSRISWPVVWAVFIVSNVVFATIILWSLPQLSQIANGLSMFDTRPSGYSLIQAQSIIDGLGKIGVEFYLGTQLWLDFFYPAMFAIAFALFIAKLLQAYQLPNWFKFCLLIAPFLTAVFDYSENHYIALMLQSDLPLTAQLVAMASFATMLKSIASTITQVTWLVLLIIFLIQKFRK